MALITSAKAGSRLRSRIKLLSAEDKGGGRTLITAENTIEIEGEDEPALLANAPVMALG